MSSKGVKEVKKGDEPKMARRHKKKLFGPVSMQTGGAVEDKGTETNLKGNVGCSGWDG